MDINWQSLSKIKNVNYICGYCGKNVGPSEGYKTKLEKNGIYICPNCLKPSYCMRSDIGEYIITPGAVFGDPVANIPKEEVRDIYNEARRCMTINCFTAAVFCCRKLLMNVSVSLDAEKNLKFVEYVDFLEKKHYIVPAARSWVDKIRKKGNDATHEIPMITENDAKQIIKFSEMLLKTIYEYPGLAMEDSPQSDQK